MTDADLTGEARERMQRLLGLLSGPPNEHLLPTIDRLIEIERNCGYQGLVEEIAKLLCAVSVPPSHPDATTVCPHCSGRISVRFACG